MNLVWSLGKKVSRDEDRTRPANGPSVSFTDRRGITISKHGTDISSVDSRTFHYPSHKLLRGRRGRTRLPTRFVNDAVPGGTE